MLVTLFSFLVCCVCDIDIGGALGAGVPRAVEVNQVHVSQRLPPGLRQIRVGFRPYGSLWIAYELGIMKHGDPPASLLS